MKSILLILAFSCLAAAQTFVRNPQKGDLYPEYAAGVYVPATPTALTAQTTRITRVVLKSTCASNVTLDFKAMIGPGALFLQTDPAPISPGQIVTADVGGVAFLGGITWQASQANCLVAWVIGQ